MRQRQKKLKCTKGNDNIRNGIAKRGVGLGFRRENFICKGQYKYTWQGEKGMGRMGDSNGMIFSTLCYCFF